MIPTSKLQAIEDGWDQWAAFVLKGLDRLDAHYEALRKEVGEIHTSVQKEISTVHTEIATLKAKAGLWGAVGAAIPVLLMLAIQLLLMQR